MNLEIKYKNQKIYKYVEIKHATKQWVIEEIKEKIRKHHEANENGNTMYQNLGDAGKPVLSLQ